MLSNYLAIKGNNGIGKLKRNNTKITAGKKRRLRPHSPLLAAQFC